MVKKCNVPHLAAQPSPQQLPSQAAHIMQLPTASSNALSWAAEFFDGDGTVIISKQQLPKRKNVTYRLRACVVQNCKETLIHFLEVLGEDHCLVKVRRQIAHNRQIFSLNYEGSHALAVLRKLEPHLVRKKIEALAAFQFWNEARMGTLPGPMGFPPEVWRSREYWRAKLHDLK